MWTLEFDGSCEKGGLGVGVMLTSPSGEIESFDALSIISVLRDFNSRYYSLIVYAWLLLPHLNFKVQTHKVEVLFRPDVPNNEDSW